MNPFEWLRSRRTRTDTVSALNMGQLTGGTSLQELSEPLADVHWVPASDNPFGIDVLDCSVFAESMVSSTSSAEIATRFGLLRQGSGEHCRGKEPATPGVTECHLEYPSEPQKDGPMFLATRMEDKWDVYYFDGDLYFARSWTGDLVYRARVAFERSRAVITKVSGQREPGRSEDPVSAVDFLVKSHVYGVVAPHPLPDMPDTHVRELALWSFARFGRRGLFGTKTDVKHFAVVRRDDGGCRLSLGTEV